MSSSRRLGDKHVALAALAVGMIATLASSPCFAEVSVTGKGIVGGALLGGEITISTEALLGVEQPWILGASGLVGAAGGGVGGYFLERASVSPRIPVFMVVGGLGFVIPTLILYLNATTGFHGEDSPPVPTEPEADPTGPDERREVSRLSPLTAPMGQALVSLNAGQFTSRVPSVDVRPLYSAEEVQQFALTQGAQYTLALFGGQF